MSTINFKDLPDGKLFRILAERRRTTDASGNKPMELSRDGQVYRKISNAYSEARDGRQIILALNDLVKPLHT